MSKITLAGLMALALICAGSLGAQESTAEAGEAAAQAAEQETPKQKRKRRKGPLFPDNVEGLEELARSAGRTIRQRTTFYGEASQSQIERARQAPPLAPLVQTPVQFARRA